MACDFRNSVNSIRDAPIAGINPASKLVKSDAPMATRNTRRIKRRFIQPRNISGIELRQQSEKEHCQHNAHCTSANTNQHRFGQQLPDHAAAARAQGGAYTQFAGPFGGTRQQQISHIPAGNQQHQANRSQQQPHQRTNGPNGDSGETLDQRAPCAGKTSISRISRVLLIKPCHDAGHLRLRLMNGHTGTEPCQRNIVPNASGRFWLVG